MNLWLRLLALIWRLRRAPALDPADPVELDMRVMPTDLDLLGHMNNGRYLSVMDLGRTALMMRLGIARIARSRGWFPLVRHVSIEYFHSLRPLQRFRLSTQVYSWDEKWFYLEQRFSVGERLCARARVKGLLRSRGGNVAPTTVLTAVGADARQPLQDPPSGDVDAR